MWGRNMSIWIICLFTVYNCLLASIFFFCANFCPDLTKMKRLNINNSFSNNAQTPIMVKCSKRLVNHHIISTLTPGLDLHLLHWGHHLFSSESGSPAGQQRVWMLLAQTSTLSSSSWWADWVHQISGPPSSADGLSHSQTTVSECMKHYLWLYLCLPHKDVF